MKRFNTTYILFLALTFVFICMLSSCTIEGSDNGELDGYWHLVETENITTNEKTDLSKEKIYYSIQGDIIMFTDLNYKSAPLVSTFKKNGSIIALSSLCLNDREKGDPKVEDISIAYVYGITEPLQKFTIEHNSSSSLTLSNGKLLLRFKKM